MIQRICCRPNTSQVRIKLQKKWNSANYVQIPHPTPVPQRKSQNPREMFSIKYSLFQGPLLSPNLNKLNATNFRLWSVFSFKKYTFKPGTIVLHNRLMYKMSTLLLQENYIGFYSRLKKKWSTLNEIIDFFLSNWLRSRKTQNK